MEFRIKPIMEDEGFELFLSDLKPKIQKEILNFLGIKFPEEENLDTFPLTIIPISD